MKPVAAASLMSPPPTPAPLQESRAAVSRIRKPAVHPVKEKPSDAQNDAPAVCIWTGRETRTPEETEPEPTAPPAQDNTPAPGSTNENGAVYDPVFGWVVPGQVEQTTSGSSGDPNKMVGDM